MALLLSFTPHTLNFKFEAGTSRGVLTSKTTYILSVRDNDYPGMYGVGEAGPLKGLSVDDVPDFEDRLYEITRQFNAAALPLDGWDVAELLDRFVPIEFPSIRFALEMALLDFESGCRQVYFDNDFARGIQQIPINGLIWMGSREFMAEQIESKLEAGYTTIKMKVGAIDFKRECELLESIRNRFSPEQITLRVDANGAFTPADAMEKLNRLAEYDLHSVEQPIRQGQTEDMRELARHSPVPVALDEELIGVWGAERKEELIDRIQPPFLILKPTLLGGFAQTREWIQLAESKGIAWWITSALESNIGLNAIAQFTAEFDNSLPQGLGTGQLYLNNFESGLTIENGFLRSRKGN